MQTICQAKKSDCLRGLKIFSVKLFVHIPKNAYLCTRLNNIVLIYYKVLESCI